MPGEMLSTTALGFVLVTFTSAFASNDHGILNEETYCAIYAVVYWLHHASRE